MPQPSHRRFLTLVFSVTLTSIMGNSLLAPVIPDILGYFGQPSSRAGLLVTATSLPGIVIAPIVGLLADRVGRRAVLVPCLAIFGAFGLAAAAAPTFLWLLVFRFGMGVGAAGLVNLAVVLIGDRFEGTERTRWVGFNAGVLTIALAVFPPVAGGLAEVGGWRLAIAPYGLGLVAAIFAYRTLDNDPTRSPEPLLPQLRSAREVLVRPALLVVFIGAATAFAIVFGVFLTALPTMLSGTFHLSSGWRGLVLAVPALTSTLAAFNLGRLLHRWSIGTVMLAAAAIWVVAFLIMGTAGLLVTLIAGALLYGLGEGAIVPSMQNLALDEAPVEHRAIVLATWTAAARLGQTIGPLVAGALIGSHGDRWAILAGSIGSAALVVLFTMNRRMHSRQTTARPGPAASSTN